MHTRQLAQAEARPAAAFGTVHVGGAEVLTDATFDPTADGNRNYCFDPLQLPAQPSDRRNVPDPLRPEKRPDMVQLRLPADPIPETPPFGLT
jgi:hypothetical protein